MKRDRDYVFAAIVALVLVVEAVVMLSFAPDRILGGDGPQYELYARNVVDHGVFSRSAAPPYEPSVYRTPGYPMFLAGLRLVADDSLLIVRVTQFLLLGLVAYLAYRIALELWDRRAARLAALMCVTYLPFLWLAQMHLTEILTAALLTGCVLLLVRSRRDPRVWRFVALGALVGLAVLVRPVYALAIGPIAAGIILWPGSVSRRRSALRATAMVAAFALTLVPWTIRNLSLTHQVRPFGVGGGLSLFASARQYDGTAGYRWDHAELQRLREAAAPALERANREAARQGTDVPLRVRQEIEVDRNLRAEARSTMSDVSIGDFIAAVPKRLAYLWAVSDYPPISTYSVWHPIAQVQHFLLLALAVVGLVLSVVRLGLRVMWPVVLFPAYLALAHLVVHSEGRYSVPARPALIVLAALGVNELWRQASSRTDHRRVEGGTAKAGVAA